MYVHSFYRCKFPKHFSAFNKINIFEKLSHTDCIFNQKFKVPAKKANYGIPSHNVSN